MTEEEVLNSGVGMVGKEHCAQGTAHGDLLCLE